MFSCVASDTFCYKLALGLEKLLVLSNWRPGLILETALNARHVRKHVIVQTDMTAETTLAYLPQNPPLLLSVPSRMFWNHARAIIEYICITDAISNLFGT